MDIELDRFKRMNLAEYAASHGYHLVRREPTRSGGSRGSTSSSLLLRHPTTDDKIVVRLDVDGHWTYFSVRDTRDNGTIIDFLQRRGVRELAAVRQELRAWSGQAREPPSEWLKPRPSAPPRDRAAVAEAFGRASLAANHSYLNSRGIQPETLSCERFDGTWRVDARGDLLFPHRDGPGPHGVCGFERKNARFSGFSAGGMKTIWKSNARNGDSRLVFTEAVIDAFSYHQIRQDPRARYASTGGAFGERQARHIQTVIAGMPIASIVVTATDNDEAGEALAARIAELAGDVPVERHRSPVGKDWNDYLQRHEREYIRSLGLPNRGLSR